VGSVTQPGWDVAVIGGGPAGISTALHLRAAAPGARIVVLEKARYPREKICAGGIGARAFRLLERSGRVAPRWARRDRDAAGGETVVVREPAAARWCAGSSTITARPEAIARGIEVREAARCSGSQRRARRDPDHRGASCGSLRGRRRRGRRHVREPAAARRAARPGRRADTGPAPICRATPRCSLRPGAAGYAFRRWSTNGPGLPRGLRARRRHGSAARRLRHLAARGLDIAGYRIKQFAERGFEPGAESRPRMLLVGGPPASISRPARASAGDRVRRVAGRTARALANDGSASRLAAHGRPPSPRAQLRVRHVAYRAFYGRAARARRMLPRIPALLAAGSRLRRVPVSGLGLIRGVVSLLPRGPRDHLIGGGA
jgi:hypothetical protein